MVSVSVIVFPISRSLFYHGKLNHKVQKTTSGKKST